MSLSERTEVARCLHPQAGLLNVLDGVVDCPNRIVVLTTNHPEKLDPALIRPGRINKKVLILSCPHLGLVAETCHSSVVQGQVLGLGKLRETM